MRKLGISIYPDKSSVSDMKTYIENAAHAGFSRIFSCLLSVDKSKAVIVEEFKDINDFAHELGFEVIVDVSPRVFNELGISYNDLSFFKEIGADGLRLDQGFTGLEEAMMTYNPYDLLIEINASMDTHTIDTIMDYQPNRFNLISCHNFYPHPYTGLSLDFFNKANAHFTRYGLRTAAFVTSQAPASFGPWPVSDGLCTLELHRNLPLDVQIKHFIAMDSVDDILISNCYPSPQELKAVSKINLTKVNFSCTLIDNLPEIETKIVLEEPHFNRGDVNENLIRSTQSRVKYKGHAFELVNVPDIIRRGDIIIESKDYGHYAGELMIAKTDMKNSGKSNVVGRINEDEVFLLDYIKPWQKFEFTR
ncbi:outer surface protein [Erysipelothrix larvae]|uniref:Outer surface protein n=1 Tax=Erysipelothrix larvae TaxID=1514105 RepID=A0A0X8GZ09_9FIRM|nr:MupG family TIM beta-alpha barrel fold protein [Erysipelothrix larvae]AMC93040.1 outer surface protein [Erysipelothrix larvae]